MYAELENQRLRAYRAPMGTTEVRYTWRVMLEGSSTARNTLMITKAMAEQKPMWIIVRLRTQRGTPEETHPTGTERHPRDSREETHPNGTEGLPAVYQGTP